MGFKELLEKLRGGSSKDDDYVKEYGRQTRAQEIVAERKKSANQRELERLHKEDQEESIKIQLEQMRKKKQKDVHFGHNPLNTKNITAKTDWDILRERNQFSTTGNMFSNQKNIFAPENQRRFE